MSKIRNIALICLLAVMIACESGDKYSPTLDLIDINLSALHYFPDSALTLLRQLENISANGLTQ